MFQCTTPRLHGETEESCKEPDSDRSLGPGLCLEPAAMFDVVNKCISEKYMHFNVQFVSGVATKPAQFIIVFYFPQHHTDLQKVTLPLCYLVTNRGLLGCEAV
jgi:hypothetical protein